MAGGGDGTLALLTGQGVSPLQVREKTQIKIDGPIVSLSLRCDGLQTLAVSATGSTHFINCGDLSTKFHSKVHAGAVYDVCHLANISDRIVTCSSDGYVTMWDVNDYSIRLKCPTLTSTHAISVTGCEDIIVAGCNDGRLMSFDCNNGENIWNIEEGHKGGATNVKISSDLRFVVSGGQEGELRVWKSNTRKMASNLKEHKARVNDIWLFPNDQYAISASRDRCLMTWDLAREERLTQHREKHGGIHCLAVASDETTVITAGEEKTLTYWDLRKMDAIRRVPLDEEVKSLALSPDNRWLATAGTGLVVKIWDANQAVEVSKASGHSRTVEKLSYSPDGKQVISVGLDHSCLVWNVYT